MDPTPSRSEDQLYFEELCAQVGDWDHLPTVVVHPAEDQADTREDQDSPMDGLILAGLVSPY
jgi:hypothetical protein